MVHFYWVDANIFVQCYNFIYCNKNRMLRIKTVFKFVKVFNILWNLLKVRKLSSRNKRLKLNAQHYGWPFVFLISNILKLNFYLIVQYGLGLMHCTIHRTVQYVPLYWLYLFCVLPVLSTVQYSTFLCNGYICLVYCQHYPLYSTVRSSLLVIFV